MRAWLLCALWFCPLAANADDSQTFDPTVPFRTDSANQQLSWYQLQPGKFPPQRSEHRVDGELVEADFIHRRGQFRAIDSGELVGFSLLPFGSVRYLNADADLRDVPLGTDCVFFLYQDKAGAFTLAATIRDPFSQLAADGRFLRLDEARLDQGKLSVSTRSLENPEAVLDRDELRVTDKTRVWRSDRQVQLGDLAVGDQMLVNLTGRTATSPGRCTDIWVGVETHKLATEEQRKRHVVFLKKRGLPAWIDRVEGKRLTATLFGDPVDLAALFKDEGIVPSQWATEHRRIDVVVANEELRTYNPPVDRRGGPVQQFETAATDGYGCCGVRWTIEPDLLLEGFRAGRVVRLFVHPAWPIEDMPFGEGLYSEAPHVRDAVEEPIQYPYRTDFANPQLRPYQLQPGVFPPLNSHHLVSGELTRVDATHRSGQFRTDGSGEQVDFTMPPCGCVRYLNADAELGDIPLATRCYFYLYQDDRGSFTRAALIMDEYTRLVGNKLAYRVEGVKLDEGKLLLASQLELVQNYKGDMVRPPDVAHGEFAVDDTTRVRKGDQELRLSDLAMGDELLLNLTGHTASSRGRCTEIWVGAETHKLASDAQRQKHAAALKEHGLPGWIDRVEGNEVTITLFGGSRDEIRAVMGDDPWGKNVFALQVDDQLRPLGASVATMKFKNHLPDGPFSAVYGSSGQRWVMEPEQLPHDYRPGQALRVFKEGWPTPQTPGLDPGDGVLDDFPR